MLQQSANGRALTCSPCSRHLLSTRPRWSVSLLHYDKKRNYCKGLLAADRCALTYPCKVRSTASHLSCPAAAAGRATVCFLPRTGMHGRCCLRMKESHGDLSARSKSRSCFAQSVAANQRCRMFCGEAPGQNELVVSWAYIQPRPASSHLGNGNFISSAFRKLLQAVKINRS